MSMALTLAMLPAPEIPSSRSAFAAMECEVSVPVDELCGLYDRHARQLWRNVRNVLVGAAGAFVQLDSSPSRGHSLLDRLLSSSKTLFQQQLQIHLETLVDKVRSSTYLSAYEPLAHIYPPELTNIILSRAFSANQFPNQAEKRYLAGRCRRTVKQISNWFRNKRGRTKKAFQEGKEPHVLNLGHTRWSEPSEPSALALPPLCDVIVDHPADSYAFIEEVDTDNLSVMSDEDAAWDMLDSDFGESDTPRPKKRCRFEPASSPIPFASTGSLRGGPDFASLLASTPSSSPQMQEKNRIPSYPPPASWKRMDSSLFKPSHLCWPSKRKREIYIAKEDADLPSTLLEFERLVIRSRRWGVLPNEARRTKPLPKKRRMPSTFTDEGSDSSSSPPPTPALTRSSSMSSVELSDPTLVLTRSASIASSLCSLEELAPVLISLGEVNRRLEQKPRN